MRKALLLGCLVGCTQVPAPESPPETAAVVLYNAQVHTLDPDHPTAVGLRMAGGVITDVYYDRVPDDLTGKRVDLQGAVALPGLVDAHGHIEDLGRDMGELDLRGTTSVEEVLDRVRERAKTVPEGQWIIGHSWDQNEWPGKAYPSAGALDVAAPRHKVWLRRISHAAWVNGAVLELAGIGPETVAPEGGEILREPSGAPTGILVDKARDLARPFLPAPTDEQLRGDLARGLGALRDLGLTQTHTMDLPVQALDVLLAMEAAGQVPIRVFVYVGDAWPELERFLQRPLDTQGLVQVVGVKLYADGALGSRSAALLEPYSDGGDTKGLLFQSTQSLAEKVGAVHRAGYQLAIHAIGDAANRQVLDVLTPIASAASRRPRVEHAQILEPSDIQRFAASGIVASVQPIHATSDMGWAVDRIGEERLVGAYAWRSLIDSGATVVFGSDFPVESANPWLGIHAAVTRENIRGEPKDGFIPDQKLTVQQALERFTTAAWEVAGRRGGQLSPGLPADVSIVDRDPFTVAPSELKDIKALRVFVAGR